MNRRKLLPVLIMLLAGAMAAILLAIGRYEITSMLWILFVVLVVFYILGCILKWSLDHIDKQNEKKDSSLDEGEVIEKQPEEKEANE
ncbi:MAG: DUF92 domain-containing protein [Lachnospiraceae bacterium]|nr:DUF92 domain-containing protein [Lachnospiraceae bacterium]